MAHGATRGLLLTKVKLKILNIMKIYIVSVASSSEYGSGIQIPQVFKTKKEALRALSAEYRAAVNEFSDCEHIDKVKRPMSFEVADYDCHMNSISGLITVHEI